MATATGIPDRRADCTHRGSRSTARRRRQITRRQRRPSSARPYHPTSPPCVGSRTRYAALALLAWLDRVLYRHPFTGASARRYATRERPAFGDLDDRLIDALPLANVRTVLDLGCGPGTFGGRLAERYPELAIVGVDPGVPVGRVIARAAGEALPLRDAAVDLAICVSS